MPIFITFLSVFLFSYFVGFCFTIITNIKTKDSYQGFWGKKFQRDQNFEKGINIASITFFCLTISFITFAVITGID